MLRKNECIDVLTGLSTGLDFYERAEDSLREWIHVSICATLDGDYRKCVVNV